MRHLVLTLTFALFASPALACGVHGTDAGNDINDWLANNASSSSSTNADDSVTGWADGGQSLHDDDRNKVDFHVDGGDNGMVEVGEGFAAEGTNEDTGLANENYWVNIELPNGNTVTINTTPTSLDHDNTGEGIQQWLYSQGQQVIRDWFETYEPEDEPQSTFVG